MNDHQLNEYAESCASDIAGDIRNNHIQKSETLEDYRDTMSDMAHEHADGSEHVIYYGKAHDICQHCNIEQGEQFLEEVGNPDPVTYDSLATVIAYGELRARIEQALETLIEVNERLEYLRGEIEGECISTGEIAELQSLSEHIDPSDVLLLQWAGVEESE